MSEITKKQTLGKPKITLKISEKFSGRSLTKYRARWNSIDDLIKKGFEINITKKFDTRPKDRAIAKNHNNDPVFQVDYADNFSAKGFICRPRRWIFDNVLKFHPYIYETFGTNNPIRFTFDIDLFDKSFDKKHFKTLMELFFRYWNTCKAFSKDCNIGWDDLLVSKVNDSEKAYKSSLHVIIRNYYFENISVCAEIAKGFILFFIKEFKKEPSDNQYHLFLKNNMDRLSKIVKKKDKHGKPVFLLDDSFWNKSLDDQATAFLDAVLGFDKCIYNDRAFRTLGSGKLAKRDYDHRLYPVDPLTWDKLAGKEGGYDWLTYSLWEKYLVTYIPEDSVFLEYNNDGNVYVPKKLNLSPISNKDDSKSMNTFSGSSFSTGEDYGWEAVFGSSNEFEQISGIIELVGYIYSNPYDEWMKAMIYFHILLRKYYGQKVMIYSKEYIIDNENVFNLFYDFSIQAKEYQKPDTDFKTVEARLKKEFNSVKLKTVENELTIRTFHGWAKNYIVSLADRCQYMDAPRIKKFKQHNRYIQLPSYIKYKGDIVTQIDLPKYSIIIIQSEPGTGKTTLIAIILKHFSALLPGYRRTLMAQLYNTLAKKEVEAKHYTMNKIEDFLKGKIKLVQIDSILKILMDGAEFLVDGTFIVYIDETSAFFKYVVGSDTFAKKSLNILQCLADVLQKSMSIICTDADISQKELDLLDRLTGHSRKIHIHTNTMVPKKDIPVNFFRENFRKFTNEDSPFLQKIINAHRNRPDIPVVICCDSKTIIQRVMKYIGRFFPTYENTHKILLYTSEDGRDSDIMKDVDTVWNKASFIGMSPSITTGVDFTCPAGVFVIHTGCSIQPRETLQQADRVRNKIYYHFLDLVGYVRKGHLDEVEFTYSYTEFVKRYTLKKNLFLERMKLKSDFRENDEVFKKCFPKLDTFNHYDFQVEFENMLVRKYSIPFFLRLFENKGYEIRCPESNTYNDIKLKDVKMDKKLVIKNIQEEIGLHREKAFDYELKYIYDSMYDWLIDNGYNDLGLKDRMEVYQYVVAYDWNGFAEDFLSANPEYNLDKVLALVTNIKCMIYDDVHHRKGLIWPGHHNKWAMLNFMPHLQKTFDSMIKRAEFLNANIQEVANDEDGFLWKLVADEKAFQVHLRMGIALRPNLDIEKIITESLKKMRLEDVIKTDAYKYDIIMQFEKFMGIEDRYKIDFEFIKDKVKNGVVLLAGEVNHLKIKNALDIHSICSNKFTKIFKYSNEVAWYDFYSMMLSLWKGYFGNIYSSSNKWVYFNGIKKNISRPIFNTISLDRHSSYLNFDTAFQKQERLIIDDDHEKTCRYCHLVYDIDSVHSCPLQTIKCPDCGTKFIRKDGHDICSYVNDQDVISISEEPVVNVCCFCKEEYFEGDKHDCPLLYINCPDCRGVFRPSEKHKCIIRGLKIILK